VGQGDAAWLIRAPAPSAADWVVRASPGWRRERRSGSLPRRSRGRVGEGAKARDFTWQTVVVHPQDYSARTAYRRPAAWYLRGQGLGVFLTSHGLAPRGAVTLEVKGRLSGKPRRTPVLLIGSGGHRYLVSLAGESEWVRNLRAAGGRAVLKRRGALTVRLVELPVEERAPVIAAYISWEGRASAKGAARTARYYFGLSPDPSLNQVAAVAGFYPVFRVEEE
jgi:deazaflavin-dependent oxidoreductase (nitroreductase family)